MKVFSRLLRSRVAAVVALGVALVSMSSLAQARDNVYWSVGIDAAPGVSVGVGNTRPVVVAPQPVYVAPQYSYAQPVYAQPVYPQPVYAQPGYGRHAYGQPIYSPAPVYVQPAPVYLQPRPVYAVPPVRYVQAPPVYVRPGSGYYEPGYGPPGHWKHRKHHPHAWQY